MAEIVPVKTEDINKYETKKFTTNAPNQSTSEIKPIDQSYTPEYTEMMLLSGNPDQMAEASAAVSAGSNIELVESGIEAANNLRNDVSNSIKNNLNDLSNIKSLDDFIEYLKRNGATLQTHIFDFNEAVIKFLEGIKDGIETSFANTSATQLEMYGALDPSERDSALEGVAANVAKDNTGEAYDRFWQSDLGKEINDKSYVKEEGAISALTKGGTTMGLYVLASLTPPGWFASAMAVTGESAENTLSEGGNINDAIVNAAPVALLDMGLNIIGGGAISKPIKNSFKKTAVKEVSAAEDISSSIWNKELRSLSNDIEKYEREANSLANETKQLEKQRDILKKQLEKKGNSIEISNQINQITEKIKENNGKLMGAISQRDSKKIEVEKILNDLHQEKESLANNILEKHRNRNQAEENRLSQINTNLERYKVEIDQLQDEINQLIARRQLLRQEMQQLGYSSRLNNEIVSLTREITDKNGKLLEKLSARTQNEIMLQTIEKNALHDDKYFEKIIDSLDPTNESAMQFLRKLSNVSDDNNGILINIINDTQGFYQSNSANSFYRYIHIGKLHQAWDDVDTLIHELGHYLHDATLSFAKPSNYSDIVSRARVISTRNNKALELANNSLRRRGARNEEAIAEMIRETEKELLEKNIDPVTARLLARLDVDANFFKESLKSNMDKAKNTIMQSTGSSVDRGNYHMALSAKTDRLGRLNQIYSPQLDDILDAVYGGTRKDLNKRSLKHIYSHSEEYYLTEEAQFKEMIANFIVLKVRGNTHDLQVLKETFGDEFYNMLDDTFNRIMS